MYSITPEGFKALEPITPLCKQLKHLWKPDKPECKKFSTHFIHSLRISTQDVILIRYLFKHCQPDFFHGYIINVKSMKVRLPGKCELRN